MKKNCAVVFRCLDPLDTRCPGYTKNTEANPCKKCKNKCSKKSCTEYLIWKQQIGYCKYACILYNENLCRSEEMSLAAAKEFLGISEEVKSVEKKKDEPVQNTLLDLIGG